MFPLVIFSVRLFRNIIMGSTQIDQDTLNFYEDFRNFLAVDSAFDETHKRKLQANRAQQKLLRLSVNQFHELATDVHDELQRRLSTASSTPGHLAPKESLHPKRNHARKKLSLLSPSRFNDLAFDILFEIERRNPSLKLFSKQDKNMVSSENRTVLKQEPPTDIASPPFTPVSPSALELGSSDSRQNTPQKTHSNNMSTSTNSTFFSDASTHVNGHYGSDISSPQSPFESSIKPDSIMASLGSQNSPAPTLFIHSQSTNDHNEVNHLQSPNSAHLQTSTLTPMKSTLVEEDSGEEEELSELSDDDAFQRHANSSGINAAMQAWAFKNSSQADITSLHPTLPVVDFSSDEGSDGDYGLARDFNVPKFQQNFDDAGSDELEDLTASIGQPMFGSSNSYDAMEAELMKSHPLHRIEEEKSPYIPPGLIKRMNANDLPEKRRSLSETMASSIPGGSRSRSLNKLDQPPGPSPDFPTSNLSSYKLELYESQIKEKDLKIQGHQAAIKDKDDEIKLLVDEGIKMDERITELENRLGESESLKESLVEENGRLHQIIGESETEKDNLTEELNSCKKELSVQSERFINQLEEKQRDMANLEIKHQKLKEKHAEAMSKQTEFAGSSASLSSQILLLESKLIKQENVSICRHRRILFFTNLL